MGKRRKNGKLVRIGADFHENLDKSSEKCELPLGCICAEDELEQQRQEEDYEANKPFVIPEEQLRGKVVRIKADYPL